MEFQKRLRDWGYYRGPVDGVLGPLSVAAIKAFLKDRQREVVSMAEAATPGQGWHRGKTRNGMVQSSPAGD